MAVYSIYCRHGASATPLLMGVKASNPDTVVQCAATPAAGLLVWSLREIPGSEHVFLKHEDSGLHARFAERNGMIALARLDLYDPLFALQLQDVGDGFVAIRNHEGSLAMGVRNGAREDGARILALPPTGSPSMQWMFGPPSA